MKWEYLIIQIYIHSCVEFGLVSCTGLVNDELKFALTKIHMGNTGGHPLINKHLD